MLKMAFKRKLEFDVSEAEECGIAVVHGVVVEVTPVKKSRSDKKVKYFNGQISDGKKSVRLVSFQPHVVRKALQVYIYIWKTLRVYIYIYIYIYIYQKSLPQVSTSMSHLHPWTDSPQDTFSSQLQKPCQQSYYHILSPDCCVVFCNEFFDFCY